MSQFTSRLASVLLVLCLLLGSSAALAAPHPSVGMNSVRAAWSWVAAALFEWSGETGETVILPKPKAGCEINPDGVNCPSAPSAKHGCEIDPNGVPRCTP